MEPVSTVNVIEYVDGSIQCVRAFMDTPEGNEKANALFTQCAKENLFSDEDIEDGLENGVLEEGAYQLFIVHSS